MDIGHGPVVEIDHRCRAELAGSRCSESRENSRLGGSRDEACRSGSSVRTLQEIRCHGIWAGGEVQATKGTAEKRASLIGEGALLNRARYVPCTRTALDWADTADLPSTTARPAGVYVQVPRNLTAWR